MLDEENPRNVYIKLESRSTEEEVNGTVWGTPSSYSGLIVVDDSNDGDDYDDAYDDENEKEYSGLSKYGNKLLQEYLRATASN